MRPVRIVIEKVRQPSTWALRLECGHTAYRSAEFSRRELPSQVPCEACKSLIGSQVKNPRGRFGTIAGYNDGLFAVEWNDSDSTRWTLDELREEAEFV